MLTIERQYPIQQINIVNPLCCVTRWPTGTCSEACSTVLGLARLGFKGSVAHATRAATADLYKQAERNSKENTLRANKSRVVQCGSFILPLIPINWRRAKLNDFRLFGLGSEICLLVGCLLYSDSDSQHLAMLCQFLGRHSQVPQKLNLRLYILKQYCNYCTMLQVFLEYCSTIIGEFKKEKGEKLQLKLAAGKA